MRNVYPIILLFTIASLFRKRLARRFPAFFCYLLISLAASIAFAYGFSPQPSREWWLWHWLIWQPLLLFGLVASVCELLWWVSLRIYPRETKALLGVTCSLALAGCFLIYRSLPEDPSIVRIASEVRRYIDAALALSLIAAGGWFWIRPPDFSDNVRRHGLLLTAFITINSSSELTTKLNGGAWRKWDMAAYILSSLCLLAWAFVMQPSEPRSRA